MLTMRQRDPLETILRGRRRDSAWKAPTDCLIPVENDALFWREQVSPYGLCKGAQSLVLAHQSIRMRYKTQPATTLSGAAFDLRALCLQMMISCQVASEISRTEITW